MACLTSESTQLHAPQVCIICRARKKGCDKVLPSCGYCTNRGLPCQYVTTTTVHKVENSNISAKRIPDYQNVPLPSTQSSTSKDGLRIASPTIRSSLLLMDTISDTCLSQFLPLNNLPGSVDEIIYLQVRRLISTTERFIDDISVQYFQGVHRWIPIVSRRRFQNDLINFRAPPCADFSVLLLSICLITSYATPASPPVVDQETMYLITKRLFAQVQAYIPSSIRLIQAGILISVFEFGHARLDAASISIGTCARMGYAIGLHKTLQKFEEPEDELRAEAEEGRNVWWRVVICERAILCESLELDRPLATFFPSSNERLPTEPEFMGSAMSDESDQTRPSVSALTGLDIGGFGREVQAAFLVDQLIVALKLTEIDIQYAELSRIDGDLQSFLSILMTQQDGTRGVYCGSIAMSIRALFALHLHMLCLPTKERDIEVRHSNSWAALDTATKMVVDIARSHMKQVGSRNIDAFPIMCAYISRAAEKHLGTSRHMDTIILSDYCEAIKKMLDHFYLRWGGVQSNSKILSQPYSC